MLTNKTVLGQIAAHWHYDSFDSPYINRIANWCVIHYQRHGRAPKKAIYSYAAEWAESNPSKEEIENTDRQLQGTIDEGKLQGKINPDHVIAVANKIFQKVRLSKLSDQIKVELQAGRVSKADELVVQYSTVEIGGSNAVDLFLDSEALKSTYAEEIVDPLVKYPGPLGLFFGDQLKRDSFIAFSGMEKGGKSYQLLDIAWTAMCQRNKVAYFQVGDLSKSQIQDRFIVRASQWPSTSSNENGTWPCSIKIPIKITHSGKWKQIAEVEYKTKEFEQPLQATQNWDESVKDVVHQKTRSNRALLRLACYPNKTCTIAKIESELNAWELGGWGIPDVLIIDYADIIAPTNFRSMPIDQIKDTWEHLRRLSMKLHCCLVTATQVNAQSYGKWQLDRTNFSGNHLKYAEVTGMIGISITGLEKEREIIRLNWLVRRSGSYSVRRACHVAGCLALSNPNIVSVYPVWHEEIEKEE
jgi:hypothetical protein